MATDAPTITAIIPTFNRCHLLPRAVKSVLSQTHRDVVIHILDNASTDDTPTVVKQLMRINSQIKCTRHDANIGLVQNFCHGLAAVSTPYFSFLCDDDWLAPGFYASAIANFNRHEDAGFCGGLTRLVLADGSEVHTPKRLDRCGMFKPGEIFLYTSSSYPPITGLVFRTDAVQSIGGLDPSVGIAFDVDLELRIAAAYRVVFDPADVAVVTIADDTATATVSSLSLLHSARSITNKLCLIPGLEPPTVAILVNRLRTRAWLEGALSVRDGRIDDAREAARILRESGASGRAAAVTAGAYLVDSTPIAPPVLRTLARARGALMRSTRTFQATRRKR